MTLKARIVAAEQRARILSPGLRVVSIRGGLDRGIASIATIDGVNLAQSEDESPEEFRARAYRVAKESHAKCLIFGGLPGWSGCADD
jgi:hypothetical protein